MPFIILDRDGVINFDSDEYIKSPDEWRAIPGSLNAISQLNRSGYKVFVVTNQSGIARGYYNLETLSHIHEKFQQELAAVGGYVEEIFFCPHHPEENCFCRKPKTGLLQQIQAKYPIIWQETYFIGDSQSDIQAALDMNCMPILVHTGNGEILLKNNPEILSIPNFPDLARAVEYVLSQQRKNNG